MRSSWFIITFPSVASPPSYNNVNGEGMRRPLEWEPRMKIVIGAARGITLIHSQFDGAARVITHNQPVSCGRTMIFLPRRKKLVLCFSY
ncbi:unnamed protein product [Linum trigynum]|uniref:Uncharacterized protein n=1 Tax=Linum trigynum TaxID=586398 RepID=A0AAV2F2S5_9ROSI